MHVAESPYKNHSTWPWPTHRKLPIVASRGKETEGASALYFTVLLLTQPACLPYNTIREIYTDPPDPRCLRLSI